MPRKPHVIIKSWTPCTCTHTRRTHSYRFTDRQERYRAGCYACECAQYQPGKAEAL